MDGFNALGERPSSSPLGVASTIDYRTSIGPTGFLGGLTYPEMQGSVGEEQQVTGFEKPRGERPELSDLQFGSLSEPLCVPTMYGASILPDAMKSWDGSRAASLPSSNASDPYSYVFGTLGEHYTNVSSGPSFDNNACGSSNWDAMSNIDPILLAESTAHGSQVLETSTQMFNLNYDTGYSLSTPVMPEEFASSSNFHDSVNYENPLLCQSVLFSYHQGPQGFEFSDPSSSSSYPSGGAPLYLPGTSFVDIPQSIEGDLTYPTPCSASRSAFSDQSSYFTRPPDDDDDDAMDETSTFPKKPRSSKLQHSKPLSVEDLAHDNSRFAKVVKAFLSIEDDGSRTVPEIAKRVQDLYCSPDEDPEKVKRMVNDVLQKHKAFWHSGRGTPYQLNLKEGRARREFPSSSRQHSSPSFAKASRRQKKKQSAPQKSSNWSENQYTTRRNAGGDNFDVTRWG